MTDNVEHDLRLACMRLARRVRNTTTSLPPHLFNVLALLEAQPDQTAGQLAAHERVTAPSMSRTVNELVERNLVAREQDSADRRCQHLSLTPAGAEALATARHERDDWMRAHFESVSDADREALRRATQIINHLLDAT